MVYTKEQRKERYYKLKGRSICVNCECRSAIVGHVRCKRCEETISKRNKVQWENVKKSFVNIPEKQHREIVFSRLKINSRLIPRPDGIDENGIFVELKKAMPHFIHGSFTTKSKYFSNFYFKKNSTEWDSEFIDKQIDADVRMLGKIRVILVKANEPGVILEDKIFDKNNVKILTVK